MNRIAITLSAFVASVGLTLAGVAPPVPRIPDEALKPLVKPDAPAAEPEDPAAIADRILKNTKDAADRLKESDPGDDTRKKQDQTLKDIDALLRQAENPPPMGGGSGDMSEQKDQDMGGGQPMGGGGGQKGMGKSGGQSGGGMSKSGGGGKQQAGSGQSKSRSWRERRRQEQQAKAGKEPGKGEPMTGPPQDPTGSGKPADQTAKGGMRDPKDPAGAGATAGGNDQGGRAGKSPPTLPVDDSVAKQVWGHLPEKLRQQMNQYYQEQFMPKYNDLLRQYYASLAEREKAQKK